MEKTYFNRDLSWLEFDRRVLYQAQDSKIPLLERARFLSIFSSNLDEFFMKRVGYLKRVALQTQLPAAAGSASILSELRTRVLKLKEERGQCFHGVLVPELRAKGIDLTEWKDLGAGEKEFCAQYFRNRVFPVLTPLAVDPAHPFPFLSNLSVSLGVKLHVPKSKDRLFARIKIPHVLPQWVRVETEPHTVGVKLIRLRDIIESNLAELFPEMVVEKVMPFRITRNADIDQVRDDVEDLLDLVEEELRLRRVAEIVRMEHSAGPDPWMLNLLETELSLGPEDFYETEGELSYKPLEEVFALNYPDLKYRPWVPVTSPAFAEEKIDFFRLLKERDVLVHHPFESFSTSVERFIHAAVEDPEVLAIKMTLYRTGDQSPFIPLLIRAAEEGKQVVCVVEVKARFDEERNIYWGEVLEKSGVHVVYGVVGLKTHCKMALIVRREQGDFKFYAHMGTGNYNSLTAKAYTDVGLFTSNPKVNSELIEIFNYLTGLSLKRNYKKFLVSPINMREKFVELIQKESEAAQQGKPAHIIAKMNSLEDQAIIDLLYEASNAGVEIDLIVRGFCCLVPGKSGLSERIRVRSVIGRFLEHSRIFYFRAGAKTPQEGKFYMGSADWMSRNLNGRVEIMVPIEDKVPRKQCWDILQALLNDKAQSWELQQDGTYVHRAATTSGGADSGEIGVHEVWMNHARDSVVRSGGGRWV